MTPHEPTTQSASKRTQIGELFPDLPTGELDELAAVMIELELDAGTGITTLDDDATAVYCIREGEADVVTDTGETLEPLGPGDAFGEIALLLTGHRTATVTARTPMRLLALSGQDFERIRARVPGLEQSLRKLSAERTGRSAP
jgi:CRP-like cAMP-binding protein